MDCVCAIGTIAKRHGVDIMGFVMRGSSGAWKQGQKLPTGQPRSPSEGTNDGTKEATGAEGAMW
jgi:hypothetical protein